MEALASMSLKLMQGLPVMTFSLPKARVNTTHLGKAMIFDLVEAKNQTSILRASFGEMIVSELISMEIHQH